VLKIKMNETEDRRVFIRKNYHATAWFFCAPTIPTQACLNEGRLGHKINSHPKGWRVFLRSFNAPHPGS